MKKILFLLFLVPIMLNAQRDYPVRDSLLANDFTSNITGFSAFNGGTVAHNSGAGTMTITTAVANSRGAIMSTAQTASTRYHVYIKASAGTASSITIYGQWANTVAILSLPCDTVISFVSAAAPGGFGANLIITPVTVGNVEIDEFRMFRVQERRLIPTRVETFSMIGSEIRKRGLKNSPYGKSVSNDFSENSAGITPFTGTVTVSGGFLNVAGAGNNLVIAGAGLFTDTCTIRYKIKVEIVDHPIILHSVWTSTNRDTIYTTGEYTGYLSRAQTVGALNGFAISSRNTGGTIRLDYLEIEELGNPFFVHNKVFLQIGHNIRATRDQSPKVGINILENANTTGGHTTLGSNVVNGARWTRFFGQSYTTGEGVSVGNNVFNASARSTVVGEEAVGVGQSSTTIGSGAEGYGTHDITLGRGAFNPNYPHPTGRPTYDGGNTMVVETSDLFGANGSWHRSPQPVSGQSRGGWPGNTGRYFAIHGVDAFDARHPQWNNSTTYEINDIVFHNDTTWFSRTNSNLNSTPTIGNSANWYFWQRDNEGPAGEFNVPGGPLRLVAGKATGSAESGAIDLIVGVGDNGPNLKDSDRLAVSFRSEQNITAGKTYMWLYDPETNTAKQVLKKEKPAFCGTNGIRGVSRLQL